MDSDNTVKIIEHLLQGMKKKLALISIIIGITIMSLLSFIKKESKSVQKPGSPMLGMILLEESNSMKIKDVVKELRAKWKLKVDDKETSDEASVLEIEGYKIAIANMDIPIPGDEIKTTAEYNYFWKNGIDEATKHRGHIILSILNAGTNPVQENLLFSKVASSILNNSIALGVYIGDRTLLLKKEFYQYNVEEMSEDNLPLYIWIYFGIRKENDKQSIYTYGLSAFNKKEMEIINSTHPPNELNEMMFNLVHYVIASNVILKKGETIGISENQKLTITESKGRYLDGTTLKIEY
jgi:hypothetical protein